MESKHMAIFIHENNFLMDEQYTFGTGCQKEIEEKLSYIEEIKKSKQCLIKKLHVISFNNIAWYIYTSIAFIVIIIFVLNENIFFCFFSFLRSFRS